MKLSDFHSARILIERRAHLLSDIHSAKGNGLGVTIQSKYQDDDIVVAARDAVVIELEYRVSMTEHELQRLGIACDEAEGGSDA